MTKFTKLNIGDTVASSGGKCFKRLSKKKAASVGLEYTLDGDSYTLTGIGTCTDTDLVIASEIDGIPVTHIANPFQNLVKLTSVTIPDSIVAIGTLAFFGCSGIKNVYITDMDAWCDISFGGVAANPLNAGANLYLNDVLVTEVTIILPNDETIIGASLFAGCGSLANVVIPDGAEKIANYVFKNCKNLASITIPDSIESIWKNAFDGCTGLTDVYYMGTEEEWASITINEGNEQLTNATIHYNYVQDV